MLIAAIDIGTNSLHLLIAQAVSAAGFEVLDRERQVVQIGRGSFRDGRLAPDAITRSVDALARCVELAKSRHVDKIVCTATAAVREAKNGGEFLQRARRATGVTPHVIPAEEEGRLIYLGVSSALELGTEPSVFVDIGGGSMQLAVGNNAKLQRVVSAPLGALRLTELFPLSDPPQPKEIAKLRRYIRRTASDILDEVGALDPATLYGSSGSIHTLAQVSARAENGKPPEQINGYEFTAASLERTTRRLLRMTVAEREKTPGIDENRAEIIIPAALVLEHVMEAFDIPSIVMSDYGVREGLVMDYLARHAGELQLLEQADDLRLRSVLHLLHRFQPGERHPPHVRDLALLLYDGLARRHRLPQTAREILRDAALLHDVGSIIGHDEHAEHSAYIIKHGQLRGVSEKDIEMVAATARFHSKGRPRRKDPRSDGLDGDERKTVTWLAAILRVAEALDRSRYSLVRTVEVVSHSRRVTLRVTAPRVAQLEMWAAERRVGLLEKLLETPVRLVRVRERRPAAAPAAPAPARVRAARSPRAPRVPTREAGPVPPPTPRSASRGPVRAPKRLARNGAR